MSIGEDAFSGCESLKTVELPPNIKSIGAFYNCTSLERVVVPNEVTEFGHSAFRSCINLTEINFPKKLTSIGDFAFEQCIGLTEIKLPDGVESIGEAAFYSCTGLTSILIPNSVKSIGKEAFKGCIGLTGILLPNGITSIDEESFSYCRNLTSVTIPDNVTSIEERAFEDCTGLTSITIPNGVVSIGSFAFSGCTGLTNITFPNDIAFIHEGAFHSCTSLTSITIPYGVTEIERTSFYGCTGLTSVTIPDSVTEIEEAAFEGCTNLTSVTIPNSITSIGNSAFENCSSLTSVTIPASVAKLGKGAFRNCPNLKDIYISKDSPLAERLKAVAPKGITVHLTDPKSAMLRELKAAISNGNDNVRGGLEEMYRKGSLQSVLPELAALRGLEQGGYHTEGDAYEHTILAVEHLPADVDNVTVLAALFHDLGKGGVHSDGTTVRQIKPDTNGDSPEYTFYGHPSVSAKMVDAISERLNLPPRTHAILRVSAEMHMNWDMAPAKVRKTILDTMTDCGVPENERQKVFDRALNTLANVMNADSLATKGNPKMRSDAFTVLADARKISKDEIVVKGKELADMAGIDVRRSSLVTQMVLDAINKGLPNTKESLKTYLETEETRKDLNKRIQEYASKLKTR